jgi:N-methylhydantoinase A
MAPARIDRVATVAQRLSSTDWRLLERAYTRLQSEAGAVIKRTLQGKVRPTVERLADMRFVGQGFELVVALPAGPYTSRSETALREAFTRIYKQTFGHVPPVGDIEIINIRVTVSAESGSGKLTVAHGAKARQSVPLKGKRRAWVGARERYEMMPVYDRYRLTVGEVVNGPAIVEEDSTTLIVPPRAKARVERSGNIVVELHGAG